MAPAMTNTQAKYSCVAASSPAKSNKRASLCGCPTHGMRYDDLLRKTDQLIKDLKMASSSQNRRAEDYYHTLEAWIRISEQRKTIDAAQHAERLLSALEKNLKGQRRTVLVPHASYYDVVLQAYAVCGGRKEAAEAAERILGRMLILCQEFTQHSEGFVMRPCEPSTKSWNIAINCWAKSCDVDAGKMAERLFRKMVDWRSYCSFRRLKNKQFSFRGWPPTERTLTGVLDAWSQSRHAHAPERATKLLNEVVESKRLQDGRFTHIRLDAAAFNTCIAAWSRSSRGREAATNAEGILRTMTMMNEKATFAKIAPNTRTYTMVLSAWAQCEKIERTGDAARRAESILNQMLRLYQDGSTIKPNILAFTNCIAAWANTQQNDAPERAEILLRRLIKLYNETGDADFKPDTYCGNAVVSAWARATRRPDSVEKAFLALRRMKSFCNIDMIGYSALLDALQKKGMADQALALLETIENVGDTESPLVPSVIEYNTVLSSLARCCRPEDAESLLTRMDDLAERPERSSVKPDRLSFTIAMDAWSRSQRPDSLQGVSKLLEEMLKRYRAGEAKLKPDQFTFSVLMKACLQTRETDREKHYSLTKALKMFRMQEFGEYNHISYSLLVLVIMKQAREHQKERLLASVFDRCKTAGAVSQGVINALGKSRLVSVDFDANWSRRVPRKEWPYTGL
ncbi:hypothetical protein MPSEU_000493100 [Mayamaea pseudoterrestris]|nr:hypothetical protein MPSEU_000493100 [Mayamaea pseudoterrestris]